MRLVVAAVQEKSRPTVEDLILSPSQVKNDVFSLCNSLERKSIAVGRRWISSRFDNRR